MEEIWLPIASAPDYEVSTEGRVRRTADRTPHPIYRWDNKRGNVYMITVVPHTTRYVARIVALTFLKPPEDQKMQLVYKNGNTLDCRVDNLRWKTKQKRADRMATMRATVKQHGRPLLTDQTVIEAVVADAQYRLAHNERFTMRDLCVKYDLKYHIVNTILLRAGIHLPKWPPHKLTDADVADIRAEYAEGGMRMIDLAVWYDVDLSMISRILSNTRRA